MAGREETEHAPIKKAPCGINRRRSVFMYCFVRSLAELLFVCCLIFFVFRSIALWMLLWIALLFAVRFDATEQGCAKIFTYDTIQF